MAGCRLRVFGFPQNRRDGDLQARRDALERGESEVLLASLDEAILRPVHLDLIGEAFLGPARRFPASADHFSQALGQRTSCTHHRATLRQASCECRRLRVGYRKVSFEREVHSSPASPLAPGIVERPGAERRVDFRGTGKFVGALPIGPEAWGSGRVVFEVVPLSGRMISEGEAMATVSRRERLSAQRRSSGSPPATPRATHAKARAPEALGRRQADASGKLDFVVARLRTVFGTAVTTELALRAQGAERDVEIADCLREGVSVPLAAQLDRLSRIAEHAQRLAAGSKPLSQSQRHSTPRRARSAGRNLARGTWHIERARHDKL